MTSSSLGARLGLARLTAWRPFVRHTDELLLVPKDLRSSDPIFADELAQGRWGLAGRVVTLRGHSPFGSSGVAVGDVGDAWLRELHGFGWLRHLKVSPSASAHEMARRLVADWMGQERMLARYNPVAWETSVAARRTMAWLANADMLLEGADASFYQRVLASIGRQVHVLQRLRRKAESFARLEAQIALAIAGLSLASVERKLERVELELFAELARQILPDGGHVSRNPEAVLELLLGLLPLRHCYLARGRSPPAQLIDFTSRMSRCLRTLQLGDGSLARFNGCGRSATDTISTVLALDTTLGELAATLPASGYVRLACGDSIVVMDCGGAPMGEHATAAQAGCLAFEMSRGRRRLIGNGGAPGPTTRAGIIAASRATLNHATLSIASQSSASMVGAGAQEPLKAGIAIAGPSNVTFTRPDLSAGQAVDATHDGYAKGFGLVHSRRLILAEDGLSLDGRDELQPPAGVLRMSRDAPFAIHFHLPADVTAVAVMDGSSAVIDTGFERWRLTVTGARASVEPSIEYAHSLGPQLGRQVVLRGTCPGHSVVVWKLARIDDAVE